MTDNVKDKTLETNCLFASFLSLQKKKKKKEEEEGRRS
jgi:hypothetical protein